MKITRFEVSNYRSFTRRSKIPLGDLTVLIGPNNEGKSNLLRALVTAARILSGGWYHRHGRYGGVRYRYRELDSYDWERDYPASLQANDAEGASSILLSFELNEGELRDFYAATDTRLTAGNLTLTLRLGREGGNIDVSMRGPAKRRLNQRRAEIAAFLREHFSLQYIPSVRISDLSEELVEGMLAGELASLEGQSAYTQLLDHLRDLQRPILDRLSGRLLETVRDFMPEVTEIRVENREGLRHALRRSSRLLVNDGTLTDLSSKGDGVQSLVAIALMRHVTETAAGSKSLLLAIEEPEAHLHPDAIHRLRKVIQETAASCQVILTTHSPLMVERARPSWNIIVRAASAKPARSLEEIRECLGVRLADNLTSAFLVVLIEGETDEKILRAWLPHLQQVLSPHLRSGTLAFDTLYGAKNLIYKTSMYKKMLCNIHALLDSDDEGRSAILTATNEGILEDSEVHIVTCPGLANSELEDLADVSSYRERIESAFRVNIGVGQFRNAQAKWSDRLRQTFLAQGRPWNRQTEARCKGIVAQAIEENPATSLHPERSGSIVALAAALVARVQLERVH